MATLTQTRSVLVVDDDADMQLLLGMFAAEAGYELAGQVGDGRAAIDTWRAHRDAGDPLDAIVLDQMMPEVKGLEAATEIRRHDPDVVLVLISAAMTPVLAQAARAAGVQHALSKDDLTTLTDALSD